MTVKELKMIIEDLPDDMEVIIPIHSLNVSTKISSFFSIGTAGVLESDCEGFPALYLGGSEPGRNIKDQIRLGRYDGEYVRCKKVLY